MNDNFNKLENALRNFKSSYIERTKRLAKDRFQKMLTDLEKHDFDLDLTAPQPDSRKPQNYRMDQARRNEFLKYFHGDISRNEIARGFRDPYYVVPNPDALEKIESTFVEGALQSFNSYVDKLSRKIGDGVETVELTGGDMWTHSVLVVKKQDGTVERWQTQCIINCSVLGNLFNQWPTRRLKIR